MRRLGFLLLTIGLAWCLTAQNLFSAQLPDQDPLTDFRKQFTEFEYGIELMEGLYNAATDGKIRAEITQRKHQGLRRLIAFGSIVFAGAKGVIEKLSIFHPDQMYYGYALVGLRVGSSLLYGLDRRLKKSADTYLYSFLETLETTTKMPNFPALPSNGEVMNRLLDLTEVIRPIIEGLQNLQHAEKNMIARFVDLRKHLFGSNPLKKISTIAGKGMAFALGSATGLSIATTGQDSTPSYWLTLSSSLVDPVVESMIDSFSEKKLTRKYLQASEILHLCQYFYDRSRYEP
jgi:hypothetical protein